MLEGFASTTDVVDSERIRIAPLAFGASLPKDLPLLYNHDAKEPAGSIDELYYDAKGQLMVRATVTHPRARRCQAFSIGAKVRDYALRDADGQNFYAEVLKAELTDVSLVERPVNPNARVLQRSRPTPTYFFYDLMRQRVELCQRLVSIMQQEVNR